MELIQGYQWDQFRHLSWLPAYMSNRKQETLTAMRSANNSKFPLWRGCPKNWPKPACGSSHCGPNCISTNPLQHLLHSNQYIVLNLYRNTFSKLMLWVISCMSPIQAQASGLIPDPRPHITACLLALYCTNRHTEDTCPLCNLLWSFLQLCTTSPSLFSNCRLSVLVSSPIVSHQWQKLQVI